MFLLKVLMPLHKVKSLSMYHPQVVLKKVFLMPDCPHCILCTRLSAPCISYQTVCTIKIIPVIYLDITVYSTYIDLNVSLLHTWAVYTLHKFIEYQNVYTINCKPECLHSTCILYNRLFTPHSYTRQFTPHIVYQTVYTTYRIPDCSHHISYTRLFTPHIVYRTVYTTFIYQTSLHHISYTRLFTSHIVYQTVYTTFIYQTSLHHISYTRLFTSHIVYQTSLHHISYT